MYKTLLPLFACLLLGATAYTEGNARSLQYAARDAVETQAWQDDLRGKLFDLLHLGDLIAAPRPPLDVEVIGDLTIGGTKLRHLKIRSTPGRFFEAVLALPEASSTACPAVVAIHGHGGSFASSFDPEEPIYKRFGGELVKQGYAVIAANVGQHDVYEAGRTLMGERLWDLVRCVDYLQSLPEVDPERMGCAGLSLGGEMAMWLGAMDTRIQATVSAGFLTVMNQMEQNHCMCWKFEGLRDLVDFADIYAMTAPRALQCQNGKREPETQFTVTLAGQALGELVPAYEAFGKRGNVELHAHEGGHEVARDALLRFFDTHLAPKQPPLVFLRPSDLSDAEGVRVEAQIPEPGPVLIPADADRTTLWYAPVAARAVPQGAEIWYQRVEKGREVYSDQRVLCLGLFSGGAFTLPQIGAGEAPWGGPDNVVMRRSPHRPTWGGFNVFQLTRYKDQDHFLYWDQPAEEGQAGAMLAVSEDGRHWEKEEGAVFTEHNDAYSLLKKEGKFLLYQTLLEDWPDKPYADNLDKFRRVQSLRESDDLRTWTAQEVFLRPDEKDPPETEFYLMKVFPYAGNYLGLIMKYYGDPAQPGKHSGILIDELVVSADARAWERPFRDTDLGFWSYADPVRMGGYLHFAIWKDGGMTTVRYRPNRFTAVSAEAEGTFLTRVFTVGHGVLRLDADASGGWIEARLADAEGNVLESLKPLRIEGAEAEDIPLVWDEEYLRPGSEYRLSVRLYQAKVFAILP